MADKKGLKQCTISKAGGISTNAAEPDKNTFRTLEKYFHFIGRLTGRGIEMKCKMCPNEKDSIKGTPYNNFYKHLEVSPPSSNFSP
jgi:hypothetical protein